ncbi:ABC transporter [Pisolithus marmoratus]|nr:ABC transporter [Pisolithus marmoratus]
MQRSKDNATEVVGASSDSEKARRTLRRSWVPRYFTFPKAYELPPPPKSVHDALMTPEASASFFSLLLFNWVTPLLSLGYARPLEAPDLYKLQDERASLRIANLVLESFERRRKEAQEYNIRLENGEVKPGLRAIWWAIHGNRAELEKLWRERDGKRKASLILAMNDSIKWFFWSGGVLKVIADTAQVTSPLVVKSIITFATNSYNSHLTGERPPSIGLGVGLAFVLLALQLISSWCMNHFFYRSMASGVLLRGGLITAIYSRSLNLTSRSRATLSNGRLVNHISTDVSRIDFCMGYFHMAWTAPIQLIVCLILLLINLGPSALAGFGLFVLVTPLNTYTVKRLFSFRLKSMEWTDKRSKSLQEMLGGMKVIKFFAWEVPFLKRISYFRHLEMGYIRTLLILRAAMNAVALSLPALASVVAFITYSVLGHPLDAATIFSSLTLFQLLRLPLMMFPMSISTISDATTACERLYDVFVAETSDETLIHNRDLDVALRVKGASFSWDSPPPQPEDDQKLKGGKRAKLHKKGTSKPSLPIQQELVDTANIFQIRDVDLEIPRGQLVAIVGAVGMGKTSLLQGLTGEMRRTAGSVEFGGTVSYCAQSAWIQNATIRDNICFGRPFEEERYWKSVSDACLEADLQILPNYDLTEVGEKGISLSGGQKQRVNICRAIYCNTDIQIFDDPLSALDAHVGKDVFYNVLKNSGSGKTRILVTHALHFLPEVDFIYTVVDGRIAERGTYHELMANEGAFAEFIREFGSKEDPFAKSEETKEAHLEAPAKRDAVRGKGLMQAEERTTGAVRWQIYQQYLSAGHGLTLVPFLFLSLVLMQGTNVMSAYWLVYWEEMKWNYPQGFYMGVYAALGVSQAFTMFSVGFVFALLTYYVSQNLHERAIRRVLHAPMSFFETTPLGRIMNRFAKDIDSIDNLIGDALRMLSATASQILGAIILISVVLPWFLVVVSVVLVVYCCVAIFYRSSARELQRIDAILRSSLYAHFSETLSGLTTIRAYGEVGRFKNENHELVDIENRAYWLAVTNQRWLGIRLDLLGAVLTFSVALLAVGTRFSISPGQTGLVLSYVLGVQQSFGWAVRQFADVENNMNSVERVVHYADEVDQEAPHDVDSAAVPETWPSEGRMVMNDVVMRYRPELPPVLKGLNMTIVPREKIGIVGRTGAGKSSVMTALFRIVELSSGSIEIDGVNIAAVGLSRLRKSLSIIPQDPFLFSGTLRTNLDPFGLYDDARLWDALKRAYLVESSRELQSNSTQVERSNDTPAHGTRFTLDSPIDEDGSNLSVGQRSLVSLARALVNDTKILILDEATASVDYETDRKIQDTIATEFRDRTILCIAHRLRTIISYDRICVLDAGTIAEFDTPVNLYSIPNGTFRGMCERSSISLNDITNASMVRALRSG